MRRRCPELGEPRLPYQRPGLLWSFRRKFGSIRHQFRRHHRVHQRYQRVAGTYHMMHTYILRSTYDCRECCFEAPAAAACGRSTDALVGFWVALCTASVYCAAAEPRIGWVILHGAYLRSVQNTPKLMFLTTSLSSFMLHGLNAAACVYVQ